jgi:hypothetical protein
LHDGVTGQRFYVTLFRGDRRNRDAAVHRGLVGASDGRPSAFADQFDIVVVHLFAEVLIQK